uniref:Uncharacterized protein n=1 Tax=Rhizophora mucronata TaxID=61149 RepID=A0A2P2KMI3_RHIMU
MKMGKKNYKRMVLARKDTKPRKVLTVPRVISLIRRSESPSFLYCKADCSATLALMDPILVREFPKWQARGARINDLRLLLPHINDGTIEKVAGDAIVSFGYFFRTSLSQTRSPEEGS